MQNKLEKILIIGGGGTGAALAYDLALRGFQVILFEKGALVSGTTGRHHGLLHSGARYAVSDPYAATECIAENRILRKLVPDALEQNGGLFVALNDDDMDYRHMFLDSCQACGIPIQPIEGARAIAMEPALNSKTKRVYAVPDAVMDAWRLPMSFFAAACMHRAEIHDFCEVVGIHTAAGSVTGIRIL